MDKATQRAEQAVDVHGLRASVAGRIAVPGDEDWDAARQAWNLAVDQRPAMVVLAESTADVVETVRFAADNGYRVALGKDPHLRAGLNVHEGRITYKAVADALKLPYVPAEQALRM